MKSETIKITKNKNKKWVEFEPVDAVMVLKICAFGCSVNENWAKMVLNLWDADDNHIFSNGDKVANFYFGYGDGVFVDKPAGLFVSKNECQLDRNDERKHNRGFLSGGGYEVAWCKEKDDWRKPLQVKMKFYCK